LQKTWNVAYIYHMSPLVFSDGPFRFLFFSKEEPRIHVHVLSADGEAKFWIEPIVSLAHSKGFSEKELNKLHKIIQDRRDEIKHRWKSHFAG
jgi:hypothetical protein